MVKALSSISASRRQCLCSPLFLLVCVAEVVAGWLLWRRRRGGGVLALALMPLELAFWVGFALPLGPPAGLARIALILLGWRSHSSAGSESTGRSAEISTAP
jgi:hypothetical protein